MKRKIIGLLTAWTCEEWIEASILQALEYCDEVIVSIGANTKGLATLEDKTLEKAQPYLDHEKIKYVPTVLGSNMSTARCTTLNNMLLPIH